MKKGIIYGLRCPLSGEIRYVGQTIKKINRRLSEHRCDKRFNTHKVNWINKLDKLNILDNLTIELLEECEEVFLNEKEQYWIEKLKQNGCKLVNLTNGGDGVGSGKICSEETKKKISESNKGKKLSEKSKKRISEKHKGMILSDDHKKSISIGLKNAYLHIEKPKITEKQRLKISNGLKKYFLENPKPKKEKIKKEREVRTYTVEEKLEKSKKVSGINNPFFGKKHTEETKKIIGEKNRIHMIGEKNQFYGKKHTNDTKEKIANKLKGNPKKLYYIYDEDSFIMCDTSINLLPFFKSNRTDNISRFCDKNKKYKGYYIKSNIKPL